MAVALGQPDFDMQLTTDKQRHRQTHDLGESYLHEGVDIFASEVSNRPGQISHRDGGSHNSDLDRSQVSKPPVRKILGQEYVSTTLRYYVHTSDYELAGVAGNLRGRPDGREVVAGQENHGFKVIPFRQRHVG